MTKDDQDGEIAKAVRDYSQNKSRIACLERRLGKFSETLRGVVGADGPVPGKLKELAEFPNDPRRDAQDLQKVLDDQVELQHFFREHNLAIS